MTIESNADFIIINTGKSAAKTYKDMQAALLQFNVEVMQVTAKNIKEFAKVICCYIGIKPVPPLPWDYKYSVIPDPDDAIKAHDADFDEYYNEVKDVLTKRFLNKVCIYCNHVNGFPDGSIDIISGMDVSEVISS